jgi:eukaryotic-like serine/threonine-protein kinase
MGVIYQAHDPEIDREVAIKLIRADLISGDDHADWLARFRQEAQAAGRCAHPNIVAIYDFAVHEGSPFLAMEYVEGSNLGQHLTRQGAVSPPEAIALIGQVLDALACAHGLGIVHRDVKPANILLLASGRVKMTDFGISRLDTSALTQTGSVLGTPSYMSPEQCRGDPVDARSDLFSTGVVLYEMLSGEKPFKGRNFTEVAFQLLNEPPADIRIKRTDLAPSLVAVLHRALAKQPADRFASAVEMAAALRATADEAADNTIVAPRAQGALSEARAVSEAPAFTEATLRTIEHRLAQHVGPIARHLVQSAARQSHSLDELHETLAQRIEQPEQRAQFRRESAGDPPAAATQSRADIAQPQVQQAERELTRYIGPIARILVKRALSTARSPDEFWQQLATHIAPEADRQAFLKKRPLPPTPPLAGGGRGKR